VKKKKTTDDVPRLLLSLNLKEKKFQATDKHEAFFEA
jgi:hypothetical protein